MSFKRHLRAGCRSCTQATAGRQNWSEIAASRSTAESLMRFSRSDSDMPIAITPRILTTVSTMGPDMVRAKTSRCSGVESPRKLPK